MRNSVIALLKQLGQNTKKGKRIWNSLTPTDRYKVRKRVAVEKSLS